MMSPLTLVALAQLFAFFWAFIGLLHHKVLPINTIVHSLKTEKLGNDLLVEITKFYGLHRASYSRELIKNYTNTRTKKINLDGLNISTLFGWDFTHTHHRNFDLSFNALRRVSDKETKFGDASIVVLDLTNNDIHSIHLQNTLIANLYLSNNKLSNFSKEVHLPEVLNVLSLGYNPIESICDYEFPLCSYLSIFQANIGIIANVVFKSKTVVLNDNPLRTVKNVTFDHVDIIHMVSCGITLDIFETFDMRFIGEDCCVLYLYGNNITLAQMQQSGYKLTDGLCRIILDYGQYLV